MLLSFFLTTGCKVTREHQYALMSGSVYAGVSTSPLKPIQQKKKKRAKCRDSKTQAIKRLQSQTLAPSSLIR